MPSSICTFRSFFLFKKAERTRRVTFLPAGWIKSLAFSGLLGLASSLHATTEQINIYGSVAVLDANGADLAPSSIILVGSFNNEVIPTTPLADGEIASLMNGNLGTVRTNLNALFGTGKPTLWGSTTVNTVFDGVAFASLSKTSTTVFAGNPIYILVFNTNSIATATQVGIFAYINGGIRTAFPAVNFGSASPSEVEFDGITMLPCLGSIDADGNYRLAAIGNGYGITSSLTASATR
jgi:hypothetical protein